MKTLRTLSGLLLPLFLSIWLIGCTTTPPQQQPLENSWQQQVQVLKKIQAWSMSGRIAVQTEDNGGQADFNWQQNGQADYMIRLQAPLGAGTTWIQGSKQGVMLRTSDGGEAFDSDVDRLVHQLQGWPLPVSGLYYWVRGLPAETSPHKITRWHANGLPEVMEQDGWRIEFRTHKSMNGRWLPRKLFISRLGEEEVDVRLIVRQWGLQ